MPGILANLCRAALPTCANVCTEIQYIPGTQLQCSHLCCSTDVGVPNKCVQTCSQRGAQDHHSKKVCGLGTGGLSRLVLWDRNQVLSETSCVFMQNSCGSH